MRKSAIRHCVGWVLSLNCNGDRLGRTRVAHSRTNARFSGETPKQVRTLFLSDIHLGMKGCQADKLLDFMRHYDADTIYLVGDIVDGWQLKSTWYWPQTHNDVVQKLLRKARKGTRLFYIPGNHDEFLRDYYGTHFGGIDVVEETIHVGGRRPALSGHPRRPVRRRDPPCPLARPPGRQGL